jgi:lipopolysaccharide export system protein LptA
MRGTRWLLLLAILAILAGIGVTYQTQQRVLATHAPPKPRALPVKMDSLREGFDHTRSEAGQKKYSIKSSTVSQEKDSSHVKLADVELKLFDKTQDYYDLVKSATTDYDQNASSMYSEGAVEMTLHVPVEGQPTRPLVQIHSSAVTFQTKSGQEFVSTDRETHFTFENGTGQCVGATYDPTKRELHLKDHAEIDWKAPTPHAPPLKIEAGDVVYKEAEGTVVLNNWARLTRDKMVVNAASGVVHMQDQVIRQVDALEAQGTDEYPKRKLEYSADEVRVVYNEYGEIEHITGRHNARLVSSSDGSETTMTSDVVDLDLATVNGESVLKRALGNGHAAISSKPAIAADGKPPETHVIHSDIIEVKMRESGREVAAVETQAPGTLDFLPNQPVQHQRHVEAERMAMVYGTNNQLESFRATKIRTETQPNAEERAKKEPVAKTRSENLSARFDPKSGQMKHMEQWGDFQYEAGDRKATASRATLEQDSNLMSLENGARVWDSTGATSADQILIDQKTGDFNAEGHVTSSRLPDKKTSPSGMLAGDEPVEAMAAHMTSANHNHLVHYEGHVAMWQGTDRISADRTDVDRDKRMVNANGNVVTQFREKSKSDADVQAAPGGPTGPIFVVVKAGSLVYTDQDRLAHYQGGVVLTRPQLQVKADDLRATLTPQDNDKKKDGDNQDQSRLEKAYADGHVEIVQAANDRTRTGTSDHAEYFTEPDNERIVLRGGEPKMVDSKKGFTRGAELTYFVNDDRLLVSGSPQQPATGRLRRRQ